MKTLEGQLIEQVQNNKRITLKPCTVLLSHYRFTWYLNPVVFQFNHTLFLVLCHVFISCSFVIRALFFFMLMFSTLHINVHMLSLHSEPEKCFACMYLNAIAALPWSRCCFLHCGNTQWASRIGFSPHKPENNNNNNNKDQIKQQLSIQPSYSFYCAHCRFINLGDIRGDLELAAFPVCAHMGAVCSHRNIVAAVTMHQDFSKHAV